MNLRKRTWCLGLAGLMVVAAPATALAGSPEFARSAEEWAKLRDNVMEYGELEGLVQEYNITVQTNQLDLNDFRQKYGDTKDDVSQKYRDMAAEIYSSVDYPDSDDPMYGYMVSSVLMAEIQAKNLEKQADDNLEDSEIIRTNYEQAEKTLVTVAQNNMVSYQKGLLELRQLEIVRDQAQTALNSAQVKMEIGSATQVDVLNAQEALQTAQRNIESKKSANETLRQKLQVMLGWKYSDTPEIQDVPAADASRIDGMNPLTDREAALENNYTLKVNRKKLSNAGSANTVESLKKTIADNEQKIGSSLVTSYQNVLAAKLAYDQAAADLELETRNTRTMELQYQQGSVSRNEYESQQQLLENKQLAVKIADMNLFQTMETYDWAVAGLASAS
ncbi:MAG: TolC family protein [Eubacteriales bacterium]|nr:TolC family protein [Eubacteriales bacterium]